MSVWTQCNGIWTGGTWVEPAWVMTDKHGTIQQINTVEPDSHDVWSVAGWIVPGLRNAHSHAFQYAMAGVAEDMSLNQTRDDFWSWRESMYRVALGLNPDEFQKWARRVYSEMRRRGITHVAEFHYLHHDGDGNPYNNPAEMCERLVAAADDAEIKITLLPVFYEQASFGKAPLPEQRRFIHKHLDHFFALVDRVEALAKKYPRVFAGIAAHSLRGVRPENIRILYERASDSLPFHMHVAEQPAEVQACLENLGKRPVEWVLENLRPERRCNLVHATHVQEHEVKGIAQSGAQVVLCPSTEGNLGDGIFPLIPFLAAGGRFCLGTDSQVTLDLREDLRWLDYSYRLQTGRRAPFADAIAQSSPKSDTRLEAGDFLWGKITSGGEAAVGSSTRANKAGGAIQEYSNGFAVGDSFDGIVIDSSHYLLRSAPTEKRLSIFCYATDLSAIAGTIVAGKFFPT